MAIDKPKNKVEGLEEKVHVWPYLVRLEFLCALFYYYRINGLVYCN